MENKGKVLNLIKAQCVGIPITFYSEAITQEEFDLICQESYDMTEEQQAQFDDIIERLRNEDENEIAQAIQ